MKGIIVLLLSCLLVAPMESNAVDIVTVGVAADRLDNTLKGVIDNAGATANIAVFNGATEARLLLQSWRRENSSLLDEGMDRLDATSANAFANLKSVTSQLLTGTVDADLAAQRLLDGAQQLASTMTLSDRPIVTGVFPAYITPGVKAPISINVRGINLDKPSVVQLALTNIKPFQPASRLQREVQFQLPERLRGGAGKQGITVPMKLSMTVPHSDWWKRIFGSTEVISYTFQSLLLPAELASVEVWYKDTSMRREQHQRREEFRYNRGGHYNSRACRADPIRPYDGYKIDVNSFVNENRGGAYGSFRRTGVTPEGFIGESCASSGRRSGYQYTDVTWTEYKDVPIVGESRMRTVMPLKWTEDLVITIPADAASPRIVIKVFDGRVFKVNNTRDDGFVTTTFDIGSNSFTVAPVPSRYTVERR